MKPRRIVGAALAAFAVDRRRARQGWPTRPPTVVVPFAAGGPIDVVAQRIRRGWLGMAQQVIVDNIPGAGGIVGASRVGKAASDGYGPARQPGHPHVQPVPLQEAAVQSSDRVHARRAPGQQHQGPGRAQGPARQHLCRIHRLCAGQPGQDAVQLSRRRLRPPTSRAAQRQDGHQHHPRALSRHRPPPCRT